MKCKCGGVTKVIDSRKSGGGIRRRRKCLECGVRFTTKEVLVEWIGEVPVEFRELRRMPDGRMVFVVMVPPSKAKTVRDSLAGLDEIEHEGEDS